MSSAVPRACWPPSYRVRSSRTGALSVLALLAAGCASAPPRNPDLISFRDVEPASETHELEDLNHLRHLLDETEQEQYRALPPEGRREMMRVFWAAIDPTPTTPENEHKQEHYRRLAYALEHFARDGNPGWDRRGEILLRLGRPVWRTSDPGHLVHGLGLIPPSEVWGYAHLGLVYEVEDGALNGNFQDSQEIRTSSRPDVGSVPLGQVKTVGNVTIRHRFPPTPSLVAKHQAERFRRQRAQGRASEERGDSHYRHDHGGPPLTFAWDVQVFRQDTGASLVEVSAAYKASELAHEDTAACSGAVLGVEAVVKTPDFREVGRLSRRLAVTAPSRGIGDDAWIIDSLFFEVEPGEYRLAFSARDSLSRALGLAQREIVVPDFSGEALALSTLQPALVVEPERGSRSVKGGYRVVPCPFRAVTGSPDLYFYYEVYGLFGPPHRLAHYEIDLVVRRRAEGTTQIASTFSGVSSDRVSREHLGLDTRSLEPGDYDVEIAVRDLATGQSASRGVGFTVLADSR